jgi:hypothetical protein
VVMAHARAALGNPASRRTTLCQCGRDRGSSNRPNLSLRSRLAERVLSISSGTGALVGETALQVKQCLPVGLIKHGAPSFYSMNCVDSRPGFRRS